MAAAAIGLAVSAVGSTPAPNLASYLNAHVRSGTNIGVAPGVDARLPGSYPAVPIGSAAALIAAQPHWMVVANPPFGDSATAWTIANGHLALSAAQWKLYAVTPPARPPPAKPKTKPRSRPPSRAHAPPPRVVPPHRPVPAGSTGSTVTVAAGGSFWSIAAQVAAERTGARTSAREIASVWRTIIAANESRLRHAGDPDLVYPGQVFVIPPP